MSTVPLMREIADSFESQLGKLRDDSTDLRSDITKAFDNFRTEVTAVHDRQIAAAHTLEKAILENIQSFEKQLNLMQTGSEE
jgi:hypothetical protein